MTPDVVTLTRFKAADVLNVVGERIRTLTALERYNPEQGASHRKREAELILGRLLALAAPADHAGTR